MFTGIIEAIGSIRAMTPKGGDVRVYVSTGKLDLADVKLGDSIAVNGVCLTVVSKSATAFDADVSKESLNCTVGLNAQDAEVNLEKAMRLSDRIGGHLVSGHVDGVGEVVQFEPVGESMLLRIRAPQALARYIARKGSVAIQGVSLTVNAVEGDVFDINLIPHTVSVTTLRHLKPGSPVNLEVDQIARYVERMLSAAVAAD